MTTIAWIDLVFILALVVMLLSNKVAPPRAFAIFIVAVVLFGRVDFSVAMSALAEPALWAVISLVVFSSALAKVNLIKRLLFGSRSKGLTRTLGRLLGVSGLLSAVVPNTAVVATVLGPASRRPNISPYQLLLPVSYMSLVAGMMTPFGTSASLMVVGVAAKEGFDLSVVDFFLPGIISTISVFLALLLFARFLLPASRHSVEQRTSVFHIEARVAAGSPLVGKSVSDNRMRQLEHFFLAEIVREGKIIAPVSPQHMIEAGDTLIFVGDVEHLDELQEMSGITVLDEDRSSRVHSVFRAVIASNSSLVGETLKSSDFRSRFDASVLGIERAGRSLSGKLGSIPLIAGDLLILASGSDFPKRDNLRTNLHILDSDDVGLIPLSKTDTTLLALAFGVFLIVSLGQLVALPVAAILLATTALLFGWITPREVKRGFPFELVIILWGSIILSMVIMQSGFAGLVAGQIAHHSAGLSPIFALAAIFLFAWLLTEFFSNASAALSVLPVALDTASITGIDPHALILATAFGASASFLIPFGYQTHLMVMAPGRYTLFDFMRLGTVVWVFYAGAAILSLWAFAL